MMETEIDQFLYDTISEFVYWTRNEGLVHELINFPNKEDIIERFLKNRMK